MTQRTDLAVEMPDLFAIQISIYFAFIHRGYDPSDMELVNTENKVTNVIHDVRYCDYNVIAEGLC
jgi:hypothetical protein